MLALRILDVTHPATEPVQRAGGGAGSSPQVVRTGRRLATAYVEGHDPRGARRPDELAGEPAPVLTWGRPLKRA